MQQAMQMVAAEIAKLITLTAQGIQIQSQSRDLLLNPPPRKVSLGGIQKDAKGEVCGAEVNAVTMQ